MQYHNIQSRKFPDLVISGGQSGADLGGLLAARALEIGTGGYAPKHFKTENGDKPELGAVFGLIEAPTDDYEARTALNIDLCDVIILICRRFESSGSRLTHKLAVDNGKPIFEVSFPTHAYVEQPELPAKIHEWLDWYEPSVIMIAGNRESVANGIQKWTQEFVMRVFA